MTPRKVSLFAAFENAVMRNTNASSKEAFGYFLETIQKDSRYLMALAEDYFYRKHADWQPKEVTPHSFTLVATPTKQARHDARESRRKENEKIVECAVRSLREVVLMDRVMPNGKRFRDCTGAELLKCGGYEAAVGRVIGPRSVVHKKLTEAELHDIRERFFKDGGTTPTRQRAGHESRASV